MNDRFPNGEKYEYPSGIESWFYNGIRHRSDGPAVIWPDGTTQWIVYGALCKTPREYQYLLGLTDMEMTFLLTKYRF